MQWFSVVNAYHSYNEEGDFRMDQRLSLGSLSSLQACKILHILRRIDPYKVAYMTAEWPAALA